VLEKYVNCTYLGMEQMVGCQRLSQQTTMTTLLLHSITTFSFPRVLALASTIAMIKISVTFLKYLLNFAYDQIIKKHFTQNKIVKMRTFKELKQNNNDQKY
jgi:hypothetical protein